MTTPTLHRGICPACLVALPHHQAKCQYRGLDADEIRQAMGERTPMPDSDAATTVADAWAQSHGCRDIAFCCKTPREAFAAGQAEARASERQRWHDAVHQLTGGHRIGWTANTDLMRLVEDTP